MSVPSLLELDEKVQKSAVPSLSDLDAGIKKKNPSEPSLAEQFTEPLPEGGLGTPLKVPSLAELSGQKESESVTPSTLKDDGYAVAGVPKEESLPKSEQLPPADGLEYKFQVGSPTDRIPGAKAFKSEALTGFNNALDRGWKQGEIADLMALGQTPSKEDIKRIAQLKREEKGLPASKAYDAFNSASGAGNALKEFSKNYFEISSQIIGESLSALVRHGSARAGVGSGVGAALGTIVPGIGTAAGAVSGYMAGMGVAGYNLEVSSSILESLAEAGIDVSDEKQLEEGFDNEEKMSAARSFANKRGVPIALFDMFSAGIAGKILSKPAKTVIGKIGKASAEVGLQSGAAGSGELTAQIVSGQKINTTSILAEMIGETAGGAPDIVVGTMIEKKKRGIDVKEDMKKSKVSPEQFENMVDISEGSGEVTPQQADELKKSYSEAQAIKDEIKKNDISKIVEVKGVIPFEEITALAEKVAAGEKIEGNEMQLFKEYSESINKEIDRIKSGAKQEVVSVAEKPAEVVATTEAAPAPVAQEPAPAMKTEVVPEVKVEEPLQTFEISAAPFFDATVKNISDANTVRESPAYKKYEESLPESARLAGVEIESIDPVVGRFEGRNEVSVNIKIKAKDLDHAEQYAAVLGVTAPEVQKATIARQYVEKGNSSENGVEYEFKIKDPEKAREALEEAGIEGADLNDKTNTVTILQLKNYPQEGLISKLSKFNKKLTQDGNREGKAETRRIDSRLIDAKRRGEILERMRGDERQGGPDRSASIQRLIERNEQFRKEGRGEKTRLKYNALRDRQKAGEELSEAEADEMRAHAKALTPTIQDAVRNSAEAYTEAKAEIDQIAADVIGDTGFVSPVGIKSPKRAAEKILGWYEGKPNKLGDGARTNIVVEDISRGQAIRDEIAKKYPGAVIRNEPAERTENGFFKNLLEVRASNGRLVEFQIITPEDLVAKEGVEKFPEGKRELASQKLEKISEDAGQDIPGGVGHWLYEINRDETVPKAIREEASKISKDYYGAFTDPAKFKESGVDINKTLSDFADKINEADKSKWENDHSTKIPKTIKGIDPSTETTNLSSQELLENDRSANMESTPDDAIGIIKASSDFSFVADIPNKLKQAWAKYLKKEGQLPLDVFERHVKMGGESASLAHEMSKNLKDLKNATREEFGKKISAKEIIRLNYALSGAEGTLSELPIKTREVIVRMRTHIDKLSKLLVDNGLAEGKLKAIIQKNLGTYLTRTYRVHDVPDWAKKVPFEVVNRAKSFVRNAYEQKGEIKTDAEIDGLINELLFKFDEETPASILSGGKLGSKDLSILKKRGDIAPEIRALWGEYGDPMVNYAKSVAKMSNLIAKGKFLNDVKAMGMGKFLFEEPTATHYKQIAAEGSKTMDPLNGLYTTPEIKAAFEEFSKAGGYDGWLGLYMKINGFSKYAKTILSFPITHVRNFLSNPLIMLRNGNLNMGALSNAAKTVFHEISKSDNKEFQDKYKQYTELGLTEEGLSYQDIQATIKDANKSMDSIESMADGTIKRLINKTTGALETAYKHEDVIYKIYSLEAEKSKYGNAFPEMPEKELNKKSAEIVRATTPTYSELPLAIRELRKIPLVGTFVSFPYEIIRTSFNTVALGLKEVKDPRTRSIGAKRLAGTMAALGLATAASQFSRMVNNVDDEEDDAMRRFLAPWMKNSELVYIKNNRNGEYKILDAANTDPHNYLKKPIMAMMQGDDPADSFIDGMKELLMPFLSEEMLLSKIIDLRRNYTAEGKKIWNEQDDLGRRMADQWGYLMKAFEPGSASGLRKIIGGAAGQLDPKTGKPYDIKTEAINQFTGQKIYNISIPQSLSLKWAKLDNDIGEAKRIYNTAFYSKGATKEQKTEAFERANNAAKRIIAEAQKDYQAAIKLGVSLDVLDEILGRVRLNDEQRSSIAEGTEYNLEPKE